MQLLLNINRTSLDSNRLVAESGEFAIYECGNDTYALVQRHEGMDWQGITISGDGLFRMSELFAKAARALYRNVAGELSPKHR